MKTPDDFIAIFHSKTRGQVKTMQELANDFSNLLPDGPFERSWLQCAFIAGYKAREEEIEQLQLEIKRTRDTLLYVCDT